jgi:FAD/FMN-containing dehydrogenase
MRRARSCCEAEAGDALEGFEVIPHASLLRVLDYLPGSRAPLGQDHAWHAVIEIVADTSDAATLRERGEALLASAFEAGLVEDATIAASEAQAEAFWALREAIAPSERQHGFAVQHDISVAPERMPDFVAAAVPAIETAWPGTRAVAFGHLGDGNVHFHVIAPPGVEREAWEADEGKAISAQVYDLVTAWGGSISAEHGIGQAKRDELARLGDPVALAMLRAVKQALDPADLLNPGKLLAPAATSA